MSEGNTKQKNGIRRVGAKIADMEYPLLKMAAARSGETQELWIATAIRERLAREGLLPKRRKSAGGEAA